MKVAFATSPVGPYSEASAPYTPNFTEGPSVVKVGDQWLIYFDAYREKYYGVVATQDFKTFTDIRDQISIPEGHKHGTIFKATESVLNGLLNKSKE
jgi:predicted GH43/DUF377 family glycosyl hydrolase